MLKRLMASLLLFAAFAPPAVRSQAPQPSVEVPDLPVGVVAPPAGRAYCYSPANVCVVTLADFQLSLHNERQAMAMITGLMAAVQEKAAALKSLERSCAARLEVVPPGKRT
jgi:hypothetical protein